MIRTLTFEPGDLPDPSPRATLIEWLAREGDRINAGATLFRYEVDKAVGEFISPVSGWLGRLLAEEGDRVARGQAIAAVADARDERITASPTPSRAEMNGHFDWSEVDSASGPPEPLAPMRKVIAERMAMSKRHIPCFYLTATVDMTGCLALRNELRRAGRKATINDMAIKASALALLRNPKVAAVYTPGGVLPRTGMNIGFAAALPDDGLVVPVIKAADRKDLVDIADEARALANKAKNGDLVPADCHGGVFSVSYLGGYEVDNFVAIVNPGEAAIMAVGKTIDTPVAVDGKVEIRPIVKITMSSDHRSIDGALAARFMGDVKRLLEQPEVLLRGE